MAELRCVYNSATLPGWELTMVSINHKPEVLAFGDVRTDTPFLVSEARKAGVGVWILEGPAYATKFVCVTMIKQIPCQFE